MKAFFLILAAFLSTTVTLTNAAALPPRDPVSHIPLSRREPHGPTIGDDSLQGIAIQARAGEEKNIPKPEPSNSNGPPTSGSDPIPDLIEKLYDGFHRIIEEEERQGKLSPGQADQDSATMKNDIMNAMGVEGSKATGVSKGSEGGRSGNESPTGSHSRSGSSCSGSGSEASEGGSNHGEEDDPTLAFISSQVDDITSEIIDGLVKKGVPQSHDLLIHIHVAACVMREHLIAMYKRHKEEMKPAEKHQKTDR
ncbi:hypothetical protein H0H93_002874 [Arthromyces matolae]|nr:hypothetical protein H0H93_002874 [Arthromyces matolae]